MRVDASVLEMLFLPFLRGKPAQHCTKLAQHNLLHFSHGIFSL
jgi:hypothetical protein